MRVDHVLPLLPRHLCEAAVAQLARIVDQDVDSAVLRHGVLDDLASIRADVVAVRNSDAAVSHDLLRHLLGELDSPLQIQRRWGGTDSAMSAGGPAWQASGLGLTGRTLLTTTEQPS
eukprot:COSAG06_NODE_7721_length_2399_cov_1.680435_4_plen_117_part_00